MPPWHWLLVPSVPSFCQCASGVRLCNTGSSCILVWNEPNCESSAFNIVKEIFGCRALTQPDHLQDTCHCALQVFQTIRPSFTACCATSARRVLTSRSTRSTPWP
uniref:Secreted protein n=1 Tax=Rhipicephalus zambeziensis TaxID=60191 RepID=A0A224YKH2_9ACAR